MKIVKITKNARMKKDSEGMYWLLIETSKGPAMFNLSAIEVNPITHEIKEIGLSQVLEAFMAEQQDPVIEPPN